MDFCLEFVILRLLLSIDFSRELLILILSIDIEYFDLWIYSRRVAIFLFYLFIFYLFSEFMTLLHW